jgi:hypothetical protein
MNPRMNTANVPDPPEAIGRSEDAGATTPATARLSAPEVMGIYGLDVLREHAVRLLRAIAALRAAANPARALSRLRSHARTLLDAVRQIRRAKALRAPRRILEDLLDVLAVAAAARAIDDLDLDDLETVVAVGAARVLDDVAVAHGLPAEGESVSVGRYAPTGGDYRVDARGCWIWLRRVTRGMAIVGERRGRGENMAGRIYWQVANGPIPKAHQVVRTCDSRLCVNPGHGRLRTLADMSRENTGRLSFEDATAIRNAAALGARIRGLAEQYAVRHWTIRDVLANRTWQDPSYVRGLPLEGASLTARRTWKSAAGDYTVDAATGCWVWLRNLSDSGHPRLPDPRRAHRHESAARVYFERAVGTVPSDRFVRRTCGNRLCVNALHGEVTVARGVAVAGATRATERGLLVRQSALAAAQPVLDQARRAAAAARAASAALWFAKSIEAPLGTGPRAGTLADVVSAGDGDPFEAVRRAELAEMLDGIDEDMIASLPDDALLDLRRRLLDADFTPSTALVTA